MPIIHLEDGVPPSSSKIILVDMSQTADILPMGGNISTEAPPKGYVWEVINMYLYAVKKLGASSGTQNFEIAVGTIPIMFGASTFAVDLFWKYGEWGSADSEQKPADAVAAVMAMQGIVVESDNPITITYNNRLDVTQTFDRSMYLTVKQTPVI